jgi:hypothetical protein
MDIRYPPNTSRTFLRVCFTELELDMWKFAESGPEPNSLLLLAQTQDWDLADTAA